MRVPLRNPAWVGPKVNASVQVLPGMSVIGNCGQLLLAALIEKSLALAVMEMLVMTSEPPPLLPMISNCVFVPPTFVVANPMDPEPKIFGCAAPPERAMEFVVPACPVLLEVMVKVDF